jgi:hypothetical protein
MEQLKEFFYDPKTGFISASKLYLKLNKTIPLATINEFLKKQKISQISLENRRKPMFKQMNVYSSNDQWQIDLIDYSKYSRWNAGFKYLLCVVDVFSRKAFVVPIKRKSDTTKDEYAIPIKQFFPIHFDGNSIKEWPNTWNSGRPSFL